jgi:hypothetical protein
MDANRFDIWTRRKFGLVAGSALAALLAARGTDDVAARRRCKRRGSQCSSSGKPCCGTLACEETVVKGVEGDFCCKSDDAACTSHASCCSTNCDASSGTCTTCRGRECDANRPCCARFACTDGFCGGCVGPGASCFAEQPCCTGIPCTGGFCDGCLGRGVVCPIEGLTCCDTDCTEGACYSEEDGPCKVDLDCKACYQGTADCNGACVDDTCTV